MKVWMENKETEELRDVKGLTAKQLMQVYGDTWIPIDHGTWRLKGTDWYLYEKEK